MEKVKKVKKAIKSIFHIDAYAIKVAIGSIVIIIIGIAFVISSFDQKNTESKDVILGIVLIIAGIVLFIFRKSKFIV